MNSLTSEDKLVFDKLCNDILSFPEIRFAGIVNYLGRQVAGGYGKGITPLVDEEQHKMKFSSHILVVALVPVFALGSPSNPRAGDYLPTQGRDAARNYAPSLAGVRVAQRGRGKCMKLCNDNFKICNHDASIRYAV